MTHSPAFTQSLELIAEVTGHHPLCVHIVGGELAAQFKEAGADMDDTTFLLVLTDALTEGGICAGDMIGDLIEAVMHA
jgi:hypothetical protein